MATYAPPVGPKSRHLLPGSDYYSAVTGKKDPDRAGPHAGLDFQPEVRGSSEPIYWLVGGVITRIVRTMVQGSSTHTGYAWHTGNYVEWKGDDGYIWHYRHMPQWAMKDLKVGQRVKAGILATYMGTTGKSNGVHLHLGCRDKWGRFVDPEPILRANGAWPLGNDYYIKESPLSAEEVKQINAHTTAETNRLIKALESIPANVWRHTIPSVETGEPTRADTHLRYTRSLAGRGRTDELVTRKLIESVASQTGMTPDELTRIVDEASRTASREGTLEALDSFEVTGQTTVTLQQKADQPRQ